MKLTMLGTGNALSLNYYNTCFVIDDGGKYFMVDAGGGNEVLRRLREAKIRWQDIHHIFVTHRHIDHILGVIWMIRLYTQNMASGKYNDNVYIYGHSEVIEILNSMAAMLLQKKQTDYIGKKLHLVTVENGETVNINGRNVTFFDILSTKTRQFGFTMSGQNDGKLTCCGDEPFNPECGEYAQNSTWLLTEAFCLFDQADTFKPYEKHHSTVKDAAELAQKLNVKNLVLYHTEDKTFDERKEKYTAEAEKYFSGKIYIPDDLETIELDF